MKCVYYLTSTLDSTHHITDDLKKAGIHPWFLHVISKDESGLKRQKIHSGNYLEKLDILRIGGIGALFGFTAGLVLTGLLALADPFGPNVPGIVYFAIVVVLTMFGSWVGGLTGVATNNIKTTKFDDEIQVGKYLILVYARKASEETVHSVMRNKHPEARLVAVDSLFFNPFSTLKRV